MYINLFDIYQKKLNSVIRIISYRYLQISSLIFCHLYMTGFFVKFSIGITVKSLGLLITRMFWDENILRQTNWYNGQMKKDKKTNKYRTAPSTHKYRTAPSTHNYRTAPSTHKYRTAPSTHEYRTDPSTHKYRTAPSTHKYRTAPSTHKYRTNPSTHKYRTAPSTHKYRTAPSPDLVHALQ